MNYSRHDHFGDFVNAAFNNLAAIVTKSANGVDCFETITPEDAAIYGFGEQAYDFGSDWKKTCANLRREAFDRAYVLCMENALHLPHERCFFLYSWNGNPYTRDVIVEAVENEEEIKFSFWLQRRDRRWLLRGIHILLKKGRNEIHLIRDEAETSGFNEVCSSLSDAVISGIVLLATKPEDQIIETTELPAATPPERKGPQGIVYPTRLIRVRTTATTRLKATTIRPVSPLKPGEVVGRCPHDRRGHERVYKKTGKRVWINETKIKGGSPNPRPAVVQIAD